MMPKLTRALERAALKRWHRRAEASHHADLSLLRRQRAAAQAMRQPLDHLIHVADQRLALPAIGNQNAEWPADADWTWRPEAWRGQIPEHGLSGPWNKDKLGSELSVFHDCPLRELTLRQARNLRQSDISAFGISLDVLGFEGSFLSLALDLPPSVLVGLGPNHLIQLEVFAEMDRPVETFARLNLRFGPNTEQIPRALPMGNGRTGVEFDLAYGKLSTHEAEQVWLDFIFDKPAMCRIELRDLTLARRPRASL